MYSLVFTCCTKARSRRNVLITAQAKQYENVAVPGCLHSTVFSTVLFTQFQGIRQGRSVTVVNFCSLSCNKKGTQTPQVHAMFKMVQTLATKKKPIFPCEVLCELRGEPEDWWNYLRMDTETYCRLLKLVTPHIVKQNTCMKRAISPHERLTATLRFLATGRNYKDLEFTTTMSKQALVKSFLKLVKLVILTKVCHT